MSVSHRLAAHRSGEATDELTRARRQIRLEIARQQLKQMSGCARALADVMSPVWILHHRELLPVGNQGIDKNFSSFVVNIIVARSVDDQELAGRRAAECL